MRSIFSSSNERAPLSAPPPGFFTWYLYASKGNPRTVVYALSLALAIIIPADILRLNSTRFEWLFERCLGFLMRESEKVRRVPFFALYR